MIRIQYFRKRGQWFKSIRDCDFAKATWHTEKIERSTLAEFMESVSRHRATLAKLDRQRL